MKKGGLFGPLAICVEQGRSRELARIPPGVLWNVPVFRSARADSRQETSPDLSGDARAAASIPDCCGTEDSRGSRHPPPPRERHTPLPGQRCPFLPGSRTRESRGCRSGSRRTRGICVARPPEPGARRTRGTFPPTQSEVSFSRDPPLPAVSRSMRTKKKGFRPLRVSGHLPNTLRRPSPRPPCLPAMPHRPATAPGVPSP